MELSALPEKTQDYLKTVWEITRDTGQPATLRSVTDQMGERASTASEAMKRLAARGLVHHERYAGITLTQQGEQLAVQIVRRHRLLEMFLCEVLDFSWDEVHEEAEILEHAITDRLIERIDAHLGFPSRDPHGHPIPTADGDVEEVAEEDLTGARVGQSLIIDRISDRDPELLRYLAAHGITPGVLVQVQPAPYSGVCVLQGPGEPLTLSESSLPLINVRRLP